MGLTLLAHLHTLNQILTKHEKYKVYKLLCKPLETEHFRILHSAPLIVQKVNVRFNS